MKTVTLFTPLLLSSLKPAKKEYTLYDAQCAGLAIRVQSGGARSWVCWLPVGGKPRRVTLGRFADLTLDEARKAIRARQAGQEPPPPPTPTCKTTFRELAEAFVTARTGINAESTLKILGYYLDTQLFPAFGHRRVVEITTPEVADWFYTYSLTRPGGANQAMGHFTTILNWARSAGHLPRDHRNPATPVRFNKRRARGRMLSSDQLRLLSRILADAPPRTQDAADAIRLILLTGCRSGEILRLRWDEVRKDRLRLTRTKTGPRTVQLNTAARKVLASLRERRRSEYVFPSVQGAKPYRSSVFDAWRGFKRDANLPQDISHVQVLMSIDAANDVRCF